MAFPSYSKSVADNFENIFAKSEKTFINAGIFDNKVVAKEEIAYFEKFLFLSQCFQKSSAAYSPESVCLWERVDLFPVTL